MRNAELPIDTALGTSRYRVIDTQVVDTRVGIAPGPTAEHARLLVTCYPCDAIVPGGALRYVVTAIRSERAMNRPQAVSASSSNAQVGALAAR